MIIAIAAVTLDGRIAAHEKHFSDWTSAEDKDVMRKLLDGSDVVLVGHNTYKTAIQPLSKRSCIVLTSSVTEVKKESDLVTYINPQYSDLKKILSEYAIVACLGGTQTYTYLLEHGMLDEIYLTIEPIIFGTGLPLFQTKHSVQQRWNLISMKSLNEHGSMLLHYKK